MTHARRRLGSYAAAAIGLFAAAAACGGGQAPVASAPGAAPLPPCPSCVLDPTRYLRQLSLDLRGRPPSIDELDAAAGAGRVSDAWLDAALASDDFLAQVRRWHQALLWPNLDTFHIGTIPISAVERAVPFSPYPALIGAGAQKHPDAVLSAYLYGVRRGRGVCDPNVEYPPPAERGAQPTYAVVGTDGKRRKYPYYDVNGVPLPYHDAAHCPNFCSSKTDAERGAKGFVGAVGAFLAMTAEGADPHPFELDPPGKHCPPTHPYRVENACDSPQPNAATPEIQIRIEGYRKVPMYWTQGASLKTCAYEAQTRVTGLYTHQACATNPVDVSCGCGPDGIDCIPATLGSFLGADTRAEHAIRAGLDDEPLQIVSSVVARDDDYFEVFTTRRSFVNGPLALFFRRQTEAAQPFAISPPAAAADLPDVPYEDLAWHEYERGPEHAGVLTTTAYLARFPTARARVAHFRAEMLCRPFIPNVSLFPGPDDPCTRESNLAKRCGCKACHAGLEPMTAWFGRWSERSSKYLDPSSYPLFDPACAPCALGATTCPQRCGEYVSNAVDGEGSRFAGMLRAGEYRTPEELARFDVGPRGMVDQSITSGELESCTVRTLWSSLVGRPMTEAEENDRLPALSRDFEAHHRSYRALVRAIVTAPEYRRLQ